VVHFRGAAKRLRVFAEAPAAATPRKLAWAAEVEGKAEPAPATVLLDQTFDTDQTFAGPECLACILPPGAILKLEPAFEAGQESRVLLDFRIQARVPEGKGSVPKFSEVPASYEARAGAQATRERLHINPYAALAVGEDPGFYQEQTTRNTSNAQLRDLDAGLGCCAIL